MDKGLTPPPFAPLSTSAYFIIILFHTVCSECNFSLTNEYPNIFIAANYSQMNVRIYSVVYIFPNECPNIFVPVVYSRMNVQIFPNEKYWQNILTNEYKRIVKMRLVAKMLLCLNIFK